MAAGFAGASLAQYDPAAAEALVLRAEEAARRSGSPYVIGAVAIAHGRMLGATGRTDAAVGRFGIAIARFAELGDVRLGLAAKSDLAHALRRGGRLDEALAAYRETIGGWVHLGHRGAVANQLENVAYVAIDQDRPDRAARLLGAAEAIREAADAPMAFDEEPELERFVERLRTMLPPERRRVRRGAGRSGRAMSAGPTSVADGVRRLRRSPARHRTPSGAPSRPGSRRRDRLCETCGPWSTLALAMRRRQPRRIRRPRALRGGHRDRGPLPAEDGLEDVLRLLERLRRRAAEHPRLPGLPRPAGDAADDQPPGRRARPGDRRRDRRRDAAGDPLGPQELLLPGPAEGLPDQPVRPAARLERAADVRDVRGRRSRSGSRGPTSRRTRPSSSTRPTPPAAG